MKIEQIITNLHPLERKTIPFLEDGIKFKELVKKSGMKDIEVMRALQWLSNKNVLSIKEEEKEVINLGKNVESYKKKGLPERRFLNAVKNGKLKVSEIIKKAGLLQGEVNICIGTLKSKAAIPF